VTRPVFEQYRQLPLCAFWVVYRCHCFQEWSTCEGCCAALRGLFFICMIVEESISCSYWSTDCCNYSFATRQSRRWHCTDIFAYLLTYFFWGCPSAAVIRSFIRPSGQILLPRCFMNGSSNLDETYSEYSLDPTDDLIS